MRHLLQGIFNYWMWYSLSTLYWT